MPDERDDEPDAVTADAAAEPAPFDEAAWLEDLFALNPWAKPFFDTHGTLTDKEAFERERRNQTLDRWKQPGDDKDTARDRWNTWAEAMLSLKTELEEAGLWQNTWKGTPKSLQRCYLEVAETNLAGRRLSGGADFIGFLFPGHADFNQTVFGAKEGFPGDARFNEARFSGIAWFDKARFSGDAWFDEARFSGNAGFTGVWFSGYAGFTGARFSGYAGFNEVRFSGNAGFNGARFSGNAGFNGVRFRGTAGFAGARFRGTAGFAEARFRGDAGFDGSRFRNDAGFDKVRFRRNAWFDGVRFSGPAGFNRAWFSRNAAFKGVQFHRAARFEGTWFGGDAWFRRVEFSGGQTSFTEAQFDGTANFVSARFGSADPAAAHGTAHFGEAIFSDDANFTRCQINIPITFAAAFFGGLAEFASCHSRVSFSLAGCSFQQVPNFIEATFHEPPRLDNLTIEDPIDRQDRWDGDPRPQDSRIASLLRVNRMKLTRDPDDEAKFRALRKLAIDSQDHERELEFHAQEIRCRRFWRDRPWGFYVCEVVEEVRGSQRRTRLVSKAEYDAFQFGTKETDPDDPNQITLRRIDKRIRPAGAGRFWFGWAYGGVSNFGRSMITPAVTWVSLVALFLLAFLFFQPSKAYLASPAAAAPALAKPVFNCPPLPAAKLNEPPPLNPLAPRVCRFADLHLRWQRDAGAALARTPSAFLFNRQCLEPVGSTPLREAFSLSLKNALIFIGWDRREAARRTYGCLYGYFYDNNGRSFPNVPFSVSLLSLVQNILSAILIFLFLLALRNLLKLK